MKKEIVVTGFCHGDADNHYRCYFFRELSGGQKFCGLWMRNVAGVFNPKKKQFKSTFCNSSKVIIETELGPAYNDNGPEIESGGRTISAF